MDQPRLLELRSGDTRSALRSFLRAVELGDTKPETFGMLGYCHFKEGNYISAEVAYDRAMLSQPDNMDWLEGKAQTYLEAERYLEAIRLQDELISRRPRSAEYWMAQTNAYLVFDRAEHDSETEYNALLLRIKLLVQEERFDECRAYAARALEIRSSEEIQNLYRQMEQATRNPS